MRAFLTFGAESSGTKLLTKLLIAGGCKGSGADEQPFEKWQDNDGFGNADPIVWRKSFPWTDRHSWPNIELDMLKPLRKYRYDDIQALVTVRNWQSLWQSQIDPRHRHVPNRDAALENIRIAYKEIFTQIAGLDLYPIIVTYEAITLYKDRAVRPLLKQLNLKHDGELPDIKDENPAYYPKL